MKVPVRATPSFPAIAVVFIALAAGLALLQLAIVLAALFAGWWWASIGMLVAALLTLWLVVARRHVESLTLLWVAPDEVPAPTLPQALYRQALAGDAAGITEDARAFLNGHPLAHYGDAVLVPALQLGRLARARREITSCQHADLRRAIARLLEAFDGAQRWEVSAARHASSLEDILEASLPGRMNPRHDACLTRADERAAPGARPDAAKEIVLCIGIALPTDELATQLLARVLRESGIDARHIKDAGDLDALHVYGIATLHVAAVCLVTMTNANAQDLGVALAGKVRSLLPHACTLGLLLPGILAHPERMPVARWVNRVVPSFTEAVRHLGARSRPPPS